MRLSRWVLAVAFSLSLAAVAGWLALAQDDGDADPAASGGNGNTVAGIANSSGDATTDETSRTAGNAGGESNAEAGSVEAGDGSDRPSAARGLRSARFSGTPIDLDPLNGLLDFGLEDVTGDVEVRSEVLDAVLRESALLSDLGDDEILRADHSNAARELPRTDDVRSGAGEPPSDQLASGRLDDLLADRHLIELNVVDAGGTARDVTSAVLDVLDDLDGLRLLDDRAADAGLARVNVADLYSGAVPRDLAVVELDAAFAASATDDVLTNLDARDAGTLDTLVARDELGRPGGVDRLDQGNLDDLDRLDGVAVLDRLDGRAWPNDLAALDLVVLEELDAARPGALGGLELVELFDLGALGLRDGLGLGPP